MASLRFLAGALANQEIELTADAMTVGRGSSCQIQVTDAGVSSKHAKVWCENNQFYVMDLGSTNGTYVNDKDVDREALADGDVVTFGMTKAEFKGDRPKARPAAAPARAAPARPGAPVARVAPRPGAPVARAAPQSAPEGIVTDDPPPQPAALRSAAPGSKEAVQLATLQKKAAFFEEENRKLRGQIKQVQEQSAHDAAAGARADAEKIRVLLHQREDEIKKLKKDLDERETYYSPSEFEREKKRMEAAIKAENVRETEALQRQLKELEHRVAIRGAEGETVSRQLKEKDDLIKMLSEREDETHTEIKKREDKIAEMQGEVQKAREQTAAAVGKEKELNDKLKQKNTQLADMGKERGLLVQDLAKVRAIITHVSKDDIDAAKQAVEEQQKASKAQQDAVTRLEGELAKARDDVSALDGKLASAASLEANAKKELEELQAELTDVRDHKAKLEGQLADMLKKAGDSDAIEKQVAMLKADRDARSKGEKDAIERANKMELDLSRIRGTYDDIIKERDDLMAKVQALESEASMSSTGAKLESDWEARYKSAQDETTELRQQIAKMKGELQSHKDQLSKSSMMRIAGGMDDSQSKLLQARATIHGQLVKDLLDNVNNSVSLLRRNSELLRGYVEDCGLLANCVRQINYTLLEPEQQQMIRELVDNTQPDVIVKNMQGISEENAESIVKAKKLILDYTDAFKQEEGETGTDVERAFARAQALLHAVDPEADVPLKSTAALPGLVPGQEESTIFAFALLRELRAFAPAEGAPAVKADTDGLSITLTAGPLDAKMKDRYKEPTEPRAVLVKGFIQDSCSGKIELNETGAALTLVITLKAKM